MKKSTKNTLTLVALAAAGYVAWKKYKSSHYSAANIPAGFTGPVAPPLGGAVSGWYR